jgi:hypothetical protein
MFTNTTGKRLYLNADKSKVVEEDSEEAAHLLVGVDGEIPIEEAEQYGLTKKAKPTAESKAVDGPPEDKGSAPEPPAQRRRSS